MAAQSVIPAQIEMTTAQVCLDTGSEEIALPVLSSPFENHVTHIVIMKELSGCCDPCPQKKWTIHTGSTTIPSLLAVEKTNFCCSNDIIITGSDGALVTTIKLDSGQFKSENRLLSGKISKPCCQDQFNVQDDQGALEFVIGTASSCDLLACLPSFVSCCTPQERSSCCACTRSLEGDLDIFPGNVQRKCFGLPSNQVIGKMSLLVQTNKCTGQVTKHTLTVRFPHGDYVGTERSCEGPASQRKLLP
eukprot:CAMPEP_0196720626 /NCGR_PEP_ID=MMETSP1091-20130531/3385_1 /TAXON_ID=302021 /ORGANISM="Rhodomonas sp., Strain CCMP768" /LENGTH=246 /DNA_ID=CAMNT_0042061919 /DNA_START=24 /DNA_END=761 /DNA_ORIENTATION=-